MRDWIENGSNGLKVANQYCGKYSRSLEQRRRRSDPGGCNAIGCACKKHRSSRKKPVGRCLLCPVRLLGRNDRVGCSAKWTSRASIQASGRMMRRACSG